MEGLAPVIVDAVLDGLERLKKEGDTALMLVEQHARLALDFADDTMVLDRGRIVFAGPSRALAAEPEKMAALLGVAGR
jgi:branched-chain amino acid transport system ATP-binding protein